MKKFTIPSTLFILLLLNAVCGQEHYKAIPLPDSLRNVNFEFSGISWNHGRLFLLPQYRNHKETRLKGPFNVYSILADSIDRVIDGRDTSLSRYNTIQVNNLDQLPDSIQQQYEGFEAITFNRDEVFLAIETNEQYDYCYILKGKLNAQHTRIDIDPIHIISLKRYPFIENAGFESLAYLPRKHKLIAIYEYNASEGGGTGYLIDPKFERPVKKLKLPFNIFRITDVQTKSGKDLYALNYYYNGDYKSYLDNNLLRRPEERIERKIPDLRENLEKNSAYLREKTTNYARIIKMDGLKARSWKQIISFPAAKNNWEGLALYKSGALVISDANRSSKQLTTLAYIDF